MVTDRNINLSTSIPAGQLQALQAQVATYWSTTCPATFLPALERLFTIIIHISMAVLVLQTFTRKQWYWVWLAVLYHSFIDFFTVPVANGVISKLGGELILCGFAVLSLIIIFSLRLRDPYQVCSLGAAKETNESAV